MKESNEGADVAILVSPWLPVWLTVPSMLFMFSILSVLPVVRFLKRGGISSLPNRRGRNAKKTFLHCLETRLV